MGTLLDFPFRYNPPVSNELSQQAETMLLTIEEAWRGLEHSSPLKPVLRKAHEALGGLVEETSHED